MLRVNQGQEPKVQLDLLAGQPERSFGNLEGALLFSKTLLVSSSVPVSPPSPTTQFLTLFSSSYLGLLGAGPG